MKHCFHIDYPKNSITFGPPTQDVVCCFCGWRYRLTKVQNSGHGRHIPEYEGYYEATPDTECTARDAGTP